MTTERGTIMNLKDQTQFLDDLYITIMEELEKEKEMEKERKRTIKGENQYLIDPEH